MKAFLKDLKELIEKHEGKCEKEGEKKEKNYVVKWRSVNFDCIEPQTETVRHTFDGATKRARKENKRFGNIINWVEELQDG